GTVFDKLLGALGHSLIRIDGMRKVIQRRRIVQELLDAHNLTPARFDMRIVLVQQRRVKVIKLVAITQHYTAIVIPIRVARITTTRAYVGMITNALNANQPSRMNLLDIVNRVLGIHTLAGKLLRKQAADLGIERNLTLVHRVCLLHDGTNAEVGVGHVSLYKL